MKKYVKPEILEREQLKVNQAIASCSYTFSGRYQNYDERAISPVYGYSSMSEALDIRWPGEAAGDWNSFDGTWGIVGPIWDVTIVHEGVTYHFYWEDFNGNEVLDYNYSQLEPRPRPDKAASDAAGYLVYQNGGLPMESNMTRDNFQAVSGGIPGGYEAWFGPKTGQIIKS